MMQKKSIITAVMILFGFIAAIHAPGHCDIVVGGALAVSAENVQSPGASFSFGLQQKAEKIPLLGENDYIRMIVNSLNYGNVGLVDNAAVYEIHYFGLDKKWDIGLRTSVDYELDDGSMGVSIGLEGIYKGIADGGLKIYLSADAARRPAIGNYFQFGLGLIFLNPEEK